jgi:hypothetical protein
MAPLLLFSVSSLKDHQHLPMCTADRRASGRMILTMSENFFRQDTDAKTVNGWIALLIVSALLTFGGFFLGALPRLGLPQLTSGLGLIGIGLLCLRGFFTLQPNEAAVMLFFGSYPVPLATAASTGSTPSTSSGACLCGRKTLPRPS